MELAYTVHSNLATSQNPDNQTDSINLAASQIPDFHTDSINMAVAINHKLDLNLAILYNLPS